jgi:hypothetical protein
MESKASKHASKCEHACARARVCVCERVRVQARSLMATLRQTRIFLLRFAVVSNYLLRFAAALGFLRR